MKADISVIFFTIPSHTADTKWAASRLVVAVAE